MTQIPTIFYPNHALLHSPQFAAIARTVPGATSNQPYNVGQGMVTSNENLSYYNDQYMTQPPAQDVNSVNPGMQHMAAPVVPPKGTNEPKARKKAEIRDPNTDRVLTDDDLRSPVPLKPETKPSKSSTSNATSTTRENAASVSLFAYFHLKQFLCISGTFLTQFPFSFLRFFLQLILGNG